VAVGGWLAGVGRGGGGACWDCVGGGHEGEDGVEENGSQEAEPVDVAEVYPAGEKKECAESGRG
jgi:hypothetical protein